MKKKTKERNKRRRSMDMEAAPKKKGATAILPQPAEVAAAPASS